MIGLFQLVGGTAKLVGQADRAQGRQRQPRTTGSRTRSRRRASAEKTEDLSSNDRPDPAVHRAGHQHDPRPDDGYDPEGLVALRDGTFWVSDEYGPYITHFDKTGKEIERLSPWGRRPYARTRHPRHRPAAPAAGRAPAPHEEQGHGGPDRHARRPDAGRDHAVGAHRARLCTARRKTALHHRHRGSSPSTSGPRRCTSTSTCSTTRPTTPATPSARSPRSPDTKFLVDERDGNVGDRPGGVQAALRDRPDRVRPT